MRKLLLSGLVAAQLAAAPAVAADLVEDRGIASQEAGSFVGARIRLSLGGDRESNQVRAGLVMAPTLRTRTADNRSTLRFGEGVELGIRGDRPVNLSIAGRPLTGDERIRTSGPRAGVSTLGWIAIGTGIAVVVGYVLFLDALRDASE